MDVRDIVLGRSARSDRAHLRSFPHNLALADGDLAEVYERHGVPVYGLDRDDSPVRAHGAGERHDSSGGCPHGGGHLVSDVDASMLAARIGIVAEGEGLQHLSGRRPRPRVGGRRQCDHGNGGSDYEAAHQLSFVRKFDNATTVAGVADVVNSAYVRESGGTGVRAGSRSDARRAPPRFAV
jgi:hypothetical protein